MDDPVKDAAMELSAQRDELSSLMNIEVPFVCQSVLKELEVVIESLLNAGRQANSSSDDFTYLELDHASLKGGMKLSGCKIISGDFALRFSKWNRSTPFKTSMNGTSPWILDQIQNGQNYAQLALQELRMLCEDAGTTSVKDVFDVVSAVSHSINLAKDELVLFSRTSFPRTTYTSKIFQPTLPPDIVIEFSVEESFLVLSAYALSILPGKPANHDSSKDIGQRNTPMLGQIHHFRNQWVQVADVLVWRYQVSNFTTALDSLNTAFRQISRLREKLLAHSTFF